MDRKNPSLAITVCHHSASLMVPIGDPRDCFFYPTLTLMIDSPHLQIDDQVRSPRPPPPPPQKKKNNKKTDPFGFIFCFLVLISHINVFSFSNYSHYLIPWLILILRFLFCFNISFPALFLNYILDFIYQIMFETSTFIFRFFP